MRYQEYLPHPSLQPYVQKLWTLETGPADPYPMQHLLTPNGAEGLILSYRQPAQAFVLNGTRIALPQAYLLINPDVPWTVITEGCSGIVGVFFKAGSLHSLLRTAMTGVVGRVVEPQAFLGSKPIRMLLEKLADAKPTARIALVEDFFRRSFSAVPHRLTTTQVALRLIEQQRGMASMEGIARQIGISRRAVEKQFAEKVGVSPKFYSRMMRFTGVQHYLISHPQASWLDITHHFGYHDQSHLVKDFYRFTGSSPLRYASSDTFLAERFIHPVSPADCF